MCSVFYMQELYNTAQQVEIEGLRAEVAKVREQLSHKEAEITYLHQQNPKSLTSDEFYSAPSTPYSSMNTEPSAPVTTGPTGEGGSFPKERDNMMVKGKQTMSTRVSELEEIVKQKHKRVVELERRLDQVTHLEPEVERLTMELSKYEQGGNNPDVTSGKNDGQLYSTHSMPTESEYVLKLRKEVDTLRPLKTRCSEAEKRVKTLEKEYRQERNEHAKLRLEIESLRKGLESTAGGMGSGDGSTIESKPRSEKHIKKDDVHEEDVTDGKQIDEREKERDVELQEKEETILILQKEVQKLEKAATALGELQRHSKVQSQQVMNLQDQAKVLDKYMYTHK